MKAHDILLNALVVMVACVAALHPVSIGFLYIARQRTRDRGEALLIHWLLVQRVVGFLVLSVALALLLAGVTGRWIVAGALVLYVMVKVFVLFVLRRHRRRTPA